MEYRNKADKELVTLLSRDDHKAFEELYVRYKDKLLRYSLYLLKSESESSDIVQEVFIQLWESRYFLNPSLSFSSFLYTITRNRILNYFKHIDVEGKIREILLDKGDLHETPETNLLSTEFQQILTEAINHLSPQQKKIFNMSRLEGLSYKEIAALTNISVYTVQEYISDSLRNIRHYVAHYSGLSIMLLLFVY